MYTVGVHTVHRSIYANSSLCVQFSATFVNNKQVDDDDVYRPSQLPPLLPPTTLPQ